MDDKKTHWLILLRVRDILFTSVMLVFQKYDQLFYNITLILRKRLVLFCREIE